MRKLLLLLFLLTLAQVSLAEPSRRPQPPLPKQSAVGPQLLHVPEAQRRVQQGILTPVPISIELPATLEAARVLVHYRVLGAPSWVTLELRRDGTSSRFRGAIPCLEVSTITGDLRYYIRIHGQDGEVLAFNGSRAAPYVVRVVHPSEQAAGDRAGARCPDPADCPPGLLGCPSAVVEDVPCKRDADCEGGETCSWRGVCEAVDRRRNHVSLSFSAGAGLVTGAGACSVAAQEGEGYACYRRHDGARYLGHPLYTNEPLRFVRAPLRAELGYERLIYFDTTLGARLGYAFLGAGPDDVGAQSFIPFSAELRATHWFADDAFASRGFAGYLLLSGGFAMFDLEGSVRVREDPTARLIQGGNDLEQTLDLWKRAGDVFVATGVGVAFRFSPGLALRAELSAVAAFPHRALLLRPSLGLEAGL
jgi:hypothetical protein